MVKYFRKSKLVCSFLILFAFFIANAQSDSISNSSSDSLTVLKPKKQKQVADTVKNSLLDTSKVLNIADTNSAVIKDTVKTVIATPQKTIDTSTYSSFYLHPYCPQLNNRTFELNELFIKKNDTAVFYMLLFPVFLLAVIRTFFGKYFFSFFQLFFQPAFRQEQTRDQLISNQVPSLLLNLTFVISSAFLLSLINQKFGFFDYNFTAVFFICLGLISLIYIVKFLFISLIAWVFNIKSALNAYLFTIFTVNKIWGILLIPFLFLLAFSPDTHIKLVLNIISVIFIVLLAYRFLHTFINLNKILKINVIYFFLYFCSIELLPIAIIFKALIQVLDLRIL